MKATREKVERTEDGKFARQPLAEHRGSVGKPSTYRKRYAAAAALLVRNGATDAQIAEFFGVAPSTISKWKVRHPTFGRALVDGSEALTPFIERSVAHRAMGMELPQEKIYYDSATGEVVRVPYVERHPPDLASARYWLERKGGPEWAPQPVRVDHRVMVAQMTDEELARALLQANEILAIAKQGEDE